MTENCPENESIPNYNKIFNLVPDPILSLDELLESDSHEFFNFTLSAIQEAVSTIQLISKVPDNVKHAFKLAKDLFVFGYFRYGFFTISQHYAFLALEAAIKTRYSSSLGNVVVLRSNKNSELIHEIKNPSFYLIEDFCWNGKKLGWDVHKLLVNNEPFPYNGKKLTRWLVDQKIIPEGKKEMYDAGLYLRNSLSHLERISIHTPSATILQRIAEQINHLFYSL